MGHLSYNDFILLNHHLSYHPGGAWATQNLFAAVPDININSYILDYGCGNGYTLEFLKTRGFKNLYGYDADPDMVQYAASKIKAIHFFSNYNNLLQELPKADIILLESVLSFNDDKQLENLKNKIVQLSQKLSVTYIGIVDLYIKNGCTEKPADDVVNWMGIKPFHTKATAGIFLQTISEFAPINYLREYPVNIEPAGIYNPQGLVKRIMATPKLSGQFADENEAMAYISKLLIILQKAAVYFNQNLICYECIIKLKQ